MADLGRWDGNVHYYHYTADTIRRHDNREAWTVAEAFVYSPDEEHSVGIVVSVSGQDIRSRGVTPADAVTRGAQLRDRLVQQHRTEAEKLRANVVYVYAIDGRVVAR